MRYQDGPRPRLFGHRGAAGLAPENTLQSFELAIAQGVDRLELDVHATRDGQVVVFHDPTLDRTTNGAGPLRDRSLAEIRELDAGYRFSGPDGGFPCRGQGVRVPLLEEVCAAFPGVPLNIEIKQGEPAIEREVLAVLERAGAVECALLTAEVDPIMQRIRAAAPGVLTGFTASEVADLLGRLDDPSYRPPGFALQVPPTFGDFIILRPELMAKAAAHGIEVHAWTINEEAEMDRLLDLGVDGLITDFPARAAAVLRRRGLRV